MEEVEITTEHIKLDQFLKFTGVADTGGQAKHMVSDGLVSVNGTVVGERRKKLFHQDVVAVRGLGIWKVVGTTR